jgi:tRNA pseudouridine38-40 synthase
VADPADPMAARRTVRLLVAYDGTDLHGFAESAGVRTVLGELTAAVARVVRAPVGLTGAGRTDAGVHAWGQVVSGAIPAGTDLGRLRRSVCRLCGPEIVVREATWAAPDFDARFSATSRTYRYDVWNDPVPNPLRARFTWHVADELDVGAMDRAAAALVGEHDFASFCRRPKPAPGRRAPRLVRRVHEARWSAVDGGPLVRFEIRASSFCHQMVRSVVGTTVDVGSGRRAAGTMAEVIAAADRNAAGRVAPPAGLVLWEVGYDGVRWDAGSSAPDPAESADPADPAEPTGS